jgi:hypothetical protein
VDRARTTRAVDQVWLRDFDSFSMSASLVVVRSMSIVFSEPSPTRSARLTLPRWISYAVAPTSSSDGHYVSSISEVDTAVALSPGVAKCPVRG